MGNEKTESQHQPQQLKKGKKRITTSVAATAAAQNTRKAKLNTRERTGPTATEKQTKATKHEPIKHTGAKRATTRCENESGRKENHTAGEK